ncbi:PKD domain-containing protein [Robiginitalea sp. IMCC44478]|uniref:PKD domain-containing protein n=1 Tax=Robiginitalea sp. IMCC44478 TaxID=3459122 RepID=UPI0040420890
MKQVLKLAKRFSLWAFALSILGLGCTDVENMFPTVTAAFTYTVNEDTGTVSFINLSEDARTYAWDFGDGSSSTEVNPFKTYSASGSYTVSLVATNSSGASDSAEDALSITIRIPASLPINFDGTNTIYNITAFDGAAFAIVEDHPAKTAKNAATSKVGELTNSGATFEGIFIDLAEDIDLTDDKTIQIEFYSEVAIDVLAKLEQGSAAAVETTASHTGSGWETLTFDYTSSASYSRLTLFADGAGTTAGTFYIDNIEQVASAGGGGGECTAETAQSLDAADFNLTFLTDPGAAIVSDGAAYSYIDNPDTDNAVNPSCKVAQVVRDNSLPFANNQILFDSKFDFDANDGFKLKVWAPVVGTNVLVKLEDKTNSAVNTEVGAVTTTANAWEELTFDFSAAASGTYDKIVLFFDINTDSGATYYFDDFGLYTAGSGATCTAETEQSLSAADLNITFQTDPGAAIVSDGAAYSYIDNPDTDNTVNPSCKVAQVVRDNSLPFANNQILFDSKFDFDANDGFKLKVWAPVVGTNVLVKLEDKTNPAVNSEVGAVTTTANAWEELTFDFSAAASGTYDKIVLFFDINTDSGATYYFDDFTLYSDGGGGTTASLELPISFDDTNVNYDFVTFNGASYSVVDNPDLSGVNTVASKVGEIVNIGAAFEGGAFTLDTPVDFSTDKAITMKFWSTTAVPILLKFEGAGAPIETTANHTGSGWEQITWTFTSSDQFSTLVLFVDGPGATAGTFYMDDIEQVPAGGGGTTASLELPISFDDTNVNYDFVTFNGASYSVVDNPDLSGVNAVASKVGEIVNVGAAFEGGAFTLDTPVDFSTDKAITMKFWSTTAVPILLKFEGAGAPIETTANHTGSGWEQITWTFTSSEQFSTLVLFVDGPGATAGTFYMDDIEQVPAGGGGGGGTTATFPLDFEDGALFFSAFEGATVAVIDNPQPTGNPSSKVLEMTKPAGVPFFAGITTDQTLNGPDINLANGLVFTMKIWSPKPNINVRMRLEQEPGVIDPPAYEIFQTSGAANEWVTLTFDFSTTPAQSSFSYTRLVLNADWDTDPAGGETFYIDDIEQGSGPPAPAAPELPISFDDPGVAYTFSTFNGASYSVVDNPDLSGVNNVASKVGQIVNSGGPFEGGAFNLASPVDFATDKQIKMKFYSNVAVPVLLKFEGAGAPVETTANHSGGGWEELTFTFTTSAQFTTLVLFVDGPGSTSGTFYMDDIEQVASGGGGGGGGTSATFPLDFEDGALFFNAFEGATVAVIDNPQTTGNPSSKVLEMTKPAGVPFFAGINSDQTLNGPDINLANGLIFTIRIWSPKPNISVRMRLEQEPGVIDPPAYEIFQTATNANEWVTLTFDFSTTPAQSSYSYTRMVLNADWGTDPAGGETYYIDDITQQ